MRNEQMNINAVDALTNNTNNTSKTKRDKKKEGDALYKTMDGLRNAVFTNGKGTDLDKFGKLYPLLETLLQNYKTNYGEDGVTRKVSEWLTKSKPYFPTLQAQAQDQDQGGFSVNYEEINKWHKRVYAAQLAISVQCMQPYTQGRIKDLFSDSPCATELSNASIASVFLSVVVIPSFSKNIALYRRWYERLQKYMPLLFEADNETPRNPVQGAEMPQIQSQTARVEQLPTESETVQNNDVSEPLEYNNISNTDVNDETITPKDTTERAEMPQIQTQTAQVEQLPTEDEKTQNNGISEPLDDNTIYNDTSNADVNRDNRQIDEQAFNEFLAMLDDNE